MTFGFLGLLLRHSIWRHVSYDVRVGHIKYFKSVSTHERTNHHSLCLTNPLMYGEWYFFILLLMASYRSYAWPANTNLLYVHVSIDILWWFRIRIHTFHSPHRKCFLRTRCMNILDFMYQYPLVIWKKQLSIT